MAGGVGSGEARAGVEVVAKDLIKVYRTGKTEVIALRGLNMRVEPGEVVAIMGPSGCGKTTLLNLIGGLDRPDAGAIVVGGKNIVEAPEAELERYRLEEVGFIFQFFNLVPTLTALENVELPMALAGKPSRRDRAMELLEMVGLADRAHHKPDELSGGEQQRVAIACALANDPPLILADEPTGELDRENAKMVIDLLTSLSRELGKTTIIATHDYMVARETDRILRMEDGLIIGEFRPGEAVFAPAADLEEELTRRVRDVKARLAELERAFKSGRVGAEEFVEKYMELSSLLKALERELRRRGH
ncbi:hypothetical protein DRO60_01430 [Candidatus Bathyarchaeota archaeon]|nr:MAG: hypothetical protein DRO60_01430 [Candidatus Bathyarchaeota archaeon]